MFGRASCPWGVPRKPMSSLNSLEPDPSPPPAPEAGGDSTFSIGAIWAGILKNWLLIAGITAVVAIGAAFYTLGQTKIYESSTTVLFDPQPLRPLGDRVETVVDTGAGYWTNKEYYKTQYWVIQSLKTTSDVVKSLG